MNVDTKLQHVFLWPIWLFIVADVVFSCSRCGCGRNGTDRLRVLSCSYSVSNDDDDERERNADVRARLKFCQLSEFVGYACGACGPRTQLSSAHTHRVIDHSPDNAKIPVSSGGRNATVHDPKPHI